VANASLTDEQLSRVRKSFFLSVPFLIAAPVLWAVGLRAWLEPIAWSMVGLGVIGWLVALALRGPVALLAHQLHVPEERAKYWVGAASGPAEEGVRVVLLLLIGASFRQALWFGFGWATIEVLYTIMSGFLLASLLGRTNPEAEKAREFLQSQGLLRESGAIYGVIERIGATALHIGFTLLVAWHPLIAVFTAIIHSAVNLVAVRLARRSLALTEAMIVIAGIVTFLLGLAAFDRL
jgi:hypothetical protein